MAKIAPTYGLPAASKVGPASKLESSSLPSARFAASPGASLQVSQVMPGRKSA